MTYQEQTITLAGSTETAAAGLYATWSTGQLATALFGASLAALLLRANVRATALADLAFASWLTVQHRRPVPTLGLTIPAGEPDRLMGAVETILADLDHVPTPEAHVARIARGAPLNAGRAAYRDAMTVHGITRYRRQPDANACALCRSLEPGLIPVGQAMYEHPACGCVAVPVPPEGETP